MSDVKSHNNVKLMTAPVYLVNFTDGHGENTTEVAIIVGEEVRFLEKGVLSKPAQQWLTRDILIAAGLRDAEEPVDNTKTAIPTPVAPPSLDDQV